MKQIEFDLLTNAKDSLRQAVELLTFADIGSKHARLKHAITGVAHCIELLLKERLRQINPAFIWENIDKYPNLDARTVSAELAISRLKSIGKLNFAPTDEKNLNSLRRTRNAIEHYEWRASEKEAKVILGSALSFIFSFAQSELSLDLERTYKDDDTWSILLNELYTFANAHGKRIEANFRSDGVFLDYCDQCEQQTVPGFDGCCLLCGHWQEID